MFSHPRAALSSTLALVLVLSLAFGSVSAVGATSDSADAVPRSAGRFLVKFTPGTSATSMAALNARHGVWQLDHIRGIDVRVMTAPAGASVAALARAYSRNPNVEFAEPDYRVRATLTPNDPYYLLQWAPPKVSAPAAWDTTTGSSSATVAILDTGVDSTHPDLAGRVVAGYDYVNHDADPTDDHGHGTMCAGVIGANGNNGLGVAGMDWAARLMAIKVLDSTGYGYESDIASAVIYAADRGARVISMSLGGRLPDETLRLAVEYAYARGCILVASSGNDGTSSVSYPAAFDHVIAVGATDSADVLASFSNYGAAQDVVAPGVSIVTTSRGGGYAYFSGTSAAAPFVSGLTGLLLAKDAGLTNTEAETAIRAGAVDLGDAGWDARYGYGRIDAAAALSNAGPPPDVVMITSAGASPNPATLGETVAFSASAADTQNHAISYEWREGETVLANTAEFSTQFLTAGTHTVTVWATCTGGSSAEQSVSLVITDPAESRTFIGKAYGDAVLDTYLYSFRSTVNFNTQTTMAVGRSSQGESRILMRFPLEKAVGSDVTRAILHLARSGGSTEVQLRAYRLARPGTVWSQATWKQYALGKAWAVPGAGGAGSDYFADVWCDSSSFTDFEVTALARAALASGATTLDLLVCDPAPVAGRSTSLYTSEYKTAILQPSLELVSISGPDTTPPAVSITSPAEGALVHGLVPITAAATDDGSGVARVEFRVDGVLLASSTSAPYAAEWDTAAVELGEHTISVTAFDGAGNSAMASRAVTVVAAPPETRTFIGKAYGDTVLDTYLYSFRSTVNFNTQTTMAVGLSSTGESRIVMRFPLEKVAGSNVTSAVLHLARSGGSAEVQLRAYRLARPGTVWSQATWKQYALGKAWAVPGAGGAGTDYFADVWCDSSSFTDFELTALARAALASGVTTLDLLVCDPAPVAGRSTSLYTSEYSVASSQPSLEVVASDVP